MPQNRETGEAREVKSLSRRGCGRIYVTVPTIKPDTNRLAPRVKQHARVDFGGEAASNRADRPLRAGRRAVIAKLMPAEQRLHRVSRLSTEVDHIVPHARPHRGDECLDPVA